VPVTNAGFEATGATALPSGWSLRGPAPDGAVVRRAEGGHGGAAAIELGADVPASLAVLSDEVSLEVGHVYRLSAWIRTAGAIADPLSRYPTAVAATLSMASFPFTNHSPAVGGMRGWTRVQTTFVATAAADRVRLDLGRNGTATGRAWFDDVSLAEIGDITEVIPLESVRWEGPAVRYEDRGWIFVHVEGAPYARGRQFGRLVADEMAAYIQKLSIRRDAKDPAQGWSTLRTLADALMLRRYDPEFLEEMKGIADGAAAGGAEVHGRKVDLVDVVAMNSAVDLDQMQSALPVTPSAVTGRTFLSAEHELALPDRTHKCSSLTATGPATASGRPVFFQLFMWDGYTGVHFNVVLDVVPERGHRFVMQTFPGGIHSGTDFYMNDAGIVIGETTVVQTPFDADGTPQSSRIRKAIQYASSIDEVAAILRERNNGMYTNDWTLADMKRGESAILLLGTKESRLWRSTDRPAPFGTPGFLWANNNARDAAVRREVAAQPEDAPYDSTFTAWNRDVAFLRFYEEHKGRIDVLSAVGLMASSPVNRPHACDGKVTDAAMAEKLVFMAHQGKVTLREKFPAAGSRRMPDLPGALPHLTYGYATFSPLVIAEGLKAARAARTATKPPAPAVLESKAVADRYAFTREDLWRGSIFPASDADNWLVAGSAAYWQILRGLPEKAADRPEALARALGGLRSRLAYITSREPDVAATKGGVAYDRYAPSFVPRIKGAFALHQLRLLSGNQAFFVFMKRFFADHRGHEVATAQFLAAARDSLGRDVEADLRPWLDRTGLPDPVPTVNVAPRGNGWQVTVTTTQPAEAYRLASTVAVEAGDARHLLPVEVNGARSTATVTVPEKPQRVVFDALADFPAATDRHHAFSSFAEDFTRTRIVYGTGRQLEANHTLALRFQQVLADAFSEILPAVVPDAEMNEEDLAAHDLFVLGDPRDNALLARLLPQLPVTAGPGFFRFQGRTYADGQDGLYLALPSPFAPQRVLHVVLANSPLQLHDMTKTYRAGLPAWAVFRGEKVETEGHFPVERFDLAVE
jgi:Phospholipase B